MRVPQEVEDQEHEQVYQRVAAIDVGKKSGMACTRVPHPDMPGRFQTKVFEVDAITAAVGELAGHLLDLQIEKVSLEATSDYWRIWYYLLEAAGLDVQLVNPREFKNVPGRKTDLLTELRVGLRQVSGQARMWVASVCRHDHWRGSTAGLVPSGSAAVRFA